MSLFKKIMSAVLVLIMILPLSACGEKKNDATVYFELLEIPENLDPQTASSDSELIVIRNLFEGLMRRNAEGKLVEGACKSYSKDGLTYKFTVRDGLKWSDGSDVKAEDFVFGIKRALDSNTGSPFAGRLFAIKNAESVNSGNAPVSSLGITSDGNKVIINLEYEDKHFLEALASSVAMPCSEKYFLETEGKYGQDANSLICNGSYDIFKWNKDEFGIRLYKNKEYTGKFEARNGAVFFSCVNSKNQVDRLSGNESDIAFLPVTELEKAEQAGVKTASVENICWFLTIGNEYSPGMRAALLKAFSDDVYASEMKFGLRAADSVYPKILNVSGTEGMGLPSYDIDGAIREFSAEIKNAEDQKFPNSVLYYYDREEIKGVITAVLGHWQQNLCAFVNIKPANSLQSLQSELSTHSLQFSAFPVTAQSASVSEYLHSIGYSGDAASAQNSMLSSKNAVPLCFESTVIAYNKSLSGVNMDIGNGYIDFAYIYKED